VRDAHPWALAPARISWSQGVPHAPGYGDVYFSRGDGLAEARGVFLAGNSLPERWREGPRDEPFVIGELGFGTGLNFTAALAAHRATPQAPPLHYVSVEAHPLGVRDRAAMLRLARARWPELVEPLAALQAAWPPLLRGWHRLVFDGGRVQLSLYLGGADAALEDWDAAGGRGADAWFPDGFAPRRNPELWNPGMLRRVARLSATGATLGTFTVAARVRSALAQAGFEVQRVPGPAGKRHVLRGRLRGTGRAAPPRPRHACVVGAGLAGACVAAALCARGIAVTVLERNPAVAANASANPWAVLHPRLPLDDGPRGPHLARAFHFARRRLAAFREDGWHPRGVVQLPDPRDPERLKRVHSRFAPTGDWLEDTAPAALEGLPRPLLHFPGGGWAALPTLCRRLLDDPRIALRLGDVAERLTRAGGAWRVQAPGGDLAADAVVVAAPDACAALLPAGELELRPLRGQLTRVASQALAALPRVLTGRGLLIPLETGGAVVGATYGPGDADPTPRPADRDANLARLRALSGLLGADADATPVEDFAGVRWTASDRTPVIGGVTPHAIAPGDAGRGAPRVITALASAGVLHAPLAAEHIAADLAGEPPVLDAATRRLLDPSRFRARRARATRRSSER